MRLLVPTQYIPFGARLRLQTLLISYLQRGRAKSDKSPADMRLRNAIVWRIRGDTGYRMVRLAALKILILRFFKDSSPTPKEINLEIPIVSSQLIQFGKRSIDLGKQLVDLLKHFIRNNWIVTALTNSNGEATLLLRPGICKIQLGSFKIHQQSYFPKYIRLQMALSCKILFAHQDLWRTFFLSFRDMSVTFPYF